MPAARCAGAEVSSALQSLGAWPSQTFADSPPGDRTVGKTAGSSVQELKGKGPGGQLGLQGRWRVLEGGGRGPPRCGRDHEVSKAGNEEQDETGKAFKARGVERLVEARCAS